MAAEIGYQAPYTGAQVDEAIELALTALQDAPADGKLYARENGEWTEVSSTDLEWLTDAEINAMFED